MGLRASTGPIQSGAQGRNGITETRCVADYRRGKKTGSARNSRIASWSFSISVNRSGFGKDLSRWVGKQTVLPSNVISAALVGKTRGIQRFFLSIFLNSSFACFAHPMVSSLTPSLVLEPLEL